MPLAADNLYERLGITNFEYTKILEKLGREPNELETYLFSAMWSEHCGYKHSKKYLKRFPKIGSVLSEENAGGVAIGDHVVFFKAESHNHPSAVEPFQGAATGIGGIVRDVLALGARPIALLDSLKFGKLKSDNVKHLFDGVVKGISAYGNSIGVPTVAGEVGFDESYNDSPLVNVMAVGIVHKDKIKISSAPSNCAVLLVGSHTGRDGIHGASFASRELNDNSKEDRPSVQVGDPFIKKVLIEATLEILKLDGVVACQDCGAAGLLSSTSEMAYKGVCGMELYLDKVHCREREMKPWEIMLSESQERMIFVVQRDWVRKVADIADKYNIPYAEIGSTTTQKGYRLYFDNELKADVSPEALNEAYEYTLSEDQPSYLDRFKKFEIRQIVSVQESIERLVSDPNFASKKSVYRQYDHMVGNRTVLKPNKSGAAGIWLYEEDKVLGLTIDSLPRQVFLNPYQGSINSVLEAYRNLVSSGFKPLGITDCLNFGNPENDEVGYQFVKSVDGISRACSELEIPVVSGNVSLYNESPNNRVYPTPTIGMVGIADSFDSLITNSAQKGDFVFLIGNQLTDESVVGGSLYQRCLYDFVGGEVPETDFDLEKRLAETIFDLKRLNLVNAANDVSEGGVFGALFECLIENRIGFEGSLVSISNLQKALFGETTGQYIITSSWKAKLENYFIENNIPHKFLGVCQGENIETDGFYFDLNKLIDLYDNAIESEMRK